MEKICLTEQLEIYQAQFEKDFRYEYHVWDAFQAFNTTRPEWEILFDAWFETSPESFAPHLARAIYYQERGSNSRGSKWAKDTTEEQFDDLIRTNLKGVFLCSREAARRMLGRGKGGAILNISSIHAAKTSYHFGAYAASKGGIESITRSCAIEWGEYGIRVNALRVGWVQVERDRLEPDHPAYGPLCRRIPVRRPGEVNDIGPLAVLLCSPQAGFITGEVIVVDGGRGVMLNTAYERGNLPEGDED